MDGVNPEISHGCWDVDSGGYEVFLRWRALLARAAGIGTEILPLGEFDRETPRLPYDSLTLPNTLGIWDEIPDEPLIILLAHADGEGAIAPMHAKLVAFRLEDLLPHLAEHSYHKPGSPLQLAEEEITRRFSTGLFDAAERGESVTFG